MKEEHKYNLRRILLIVTGFIFTVFVMEYSIKYMYPLKYEEYVNKYSQEFRVDKYLIYSIIKAESGFDKDAVSKRYAKGLMQIADMTGEWGASTLDIDIKSDRYLYEPKTNIRIGSWYISTLMKEFNDDIDLVLAAYNGGSGNVNEWLKDKKYSYDGTKLDKIPFRETEKFIKKVKKFYCTYKYIYEKTK